MTLQSTSPLAERLRPQSLGDITGQDHLTGPAGTLTRMLARGSLASPVTAWWRKRYWRNGERTSVGTTSNSLTSKQHIHTSSLMCMSSSRHSPSLPRAAGHTTNAASITVTTKTYCCNATSKNNSDGGTKRAFHAWSTKFQSPFS